MFILKTTPILCLCALLLMTHSFNGLSAMSETHKSTPVHLNSFPASQLLFGGSVADIFQGKNGTQVHLLPQGEVTLTLLDSGGKVVWGPMAYASPMIMPLPTATLPSGTYKLLANHLGTTEEHPIYL